MLVGEVDEVEANADLQGYNAAQLYSIAQVLNFFSPVATTNVHSCECDQ